ncbi:MAG TPA: lactate racemase domain-containing protein, partial [Microthrixaceae bacterium]|nr:lactate racemase domain-containing protein [Microthrixaceae bacterium]
MLDVDRSTPPVLLHSGEQFRLERLPAGRSRIIYPPEPLPGLERPQEAIRDALDNPVDSDPLSALLFPDMKLTIAFDDISLPLPKMRRPDIRQRVIEAVLDLAAEAGVDDIHLIAALALHRRMTEAELRYCLGDRIYDAFAPRGQLYNHDAEDPDGMVILGQTRHGEDVQMSKRAAESDLIVYVNINLVSMDGGWKSTATGLSGYQGVRQHHNVKTMRNARSFMDQENSELHRSNWRQGEVLRDAGVKIFQIETTVNNDLFGDGPMSVLAKREWEWSARDRATFIGVKTGLDRLRPAARRKILHSWEAPYALTSIHAGEVEAVHKLTTAEVYRQQLIPVEGQTDMGPSP